MVLSLEAEEATAHLTILGWWPVKYKYHWAPAKKYVGLRSATQVCSYRWGKVEFSSVHDSMAFEEIEWWQLTDDTINQLVKTIDNSLIGW